VAALLWVLRHVPDRVLVEPLNRWLTRAWASLTSRSGASAALGPRIDREWLLWMSADHYYDTGRLKALGWRPLYPISSAGLPETVRSLLADRLLPAGGGPPAPP
jgi:hypothetical protein